MAKIAVLFGAAVVCAALVGCGGGGSDKQTPTAVPGDSQISANGSAVASIGASIVAAGTTSPTTAANATAVTPFPNRPPTATPLAGTVGVSVASGDVAAGSELTVPITVSPPPGRKLGSWIVDVTFDPAVLAVGACDGEGTSVCNPAYTPNTLRLVGVSVDGLDGKIGTVTFKANGSAGAKSAIQVNAASCTTPDSQPVTCTGAAGTITVK